MAITLKRQLTNEEKERVLEVHGRTCFATGHPISDNAPIHFDHIRAFAEGGQSELDNIATMCEAHNRAKGTLPLEDFRVRLRLEDFFNRADELTLQHLLRYLKEKNDIDTYGETVLVEEDAGQVRIESNGIGKLYDLYECPLTNWKYFYATLPVAILNSDDARDEAKGLQPRYLIFDKVFKMYRHFQHAPVLQPSIGRVHKSKILVFDGQHKIAALLWTGRRVFECKIYLNPDVRKLNQTNISAHDKFSQTRFYSSIMITKLGSEFGTDFEEYKNLENGEIKSEAGFMKYLAAKDATTRGERNRKFRSYLYNSVLKNKDNQIAQFVSASNRSTDNKPLTIDMLSKSIFACFLYREPVEDNMATEAYKRAKEIDHVVGLMNALYGLALCRWNPNAGKNDTTQRKLVRLFRSKSIMAWAELLRDAICGKLDIQDAEERARPFYREFSESELAKIKDVVGRLVDWKMWKSPPDDAIDRILADNKSAIKT